MGRDGDFGDVTTTFTCEMSYYGSFVAAEEKLVGQTSRCL